MLFMVICKKNKIYTCFVRKNVVLYIAHGRVAQLGECCIRIAEVEGSTPFASTKNNAHHFGARYFLYMMPKGVEPGRVTAQRKRFGEPFSFILC